ncbi:MAG: single-stranded-DNA-specific exonuclease RecJ [Clostridia bacterium]|nr:single-stranded-DNA-specific exonuclease RecJ [Clostridia bacterium]
MSLKKWRIGAADKAAANIIANECDIDPFAALIAVSRGITDASELEMMISNEPVLCDPRELADISVAADYLNAAVSDNKKIAVFGDYDCDGVVATAIMFDYLKSRGADVCFYIPDRIEEGYGMSREAVLKLHNEGVNVIVTVDNGISCADEVAYAGSLGIEVVVTDHHLPPENLPEAVAVVDPHRTDCRSSFKEICGAQVAFKLICVMEDKEPEQMLYRYGDLLTVAVIGDVMPLINENRSIVKYGLCIIKNKPRTGLSALINSAGIDRNTINAAKVSFGIVPRINTAGRMDSALRAFELLTSKDMLSALKIAGELEDLNALRQKTEKDIFTEAVEQIEQSGYRYNRVIVVSGNNWHMGVMGIVASRICEKYSKPAIVLSVNGDIAHGSGRSYEGFALYEAISACSDILIKYGGHALAAGVTLGAGDIDEFRKRINRYARSEAYCPPELRLDLKLNPAAVNIDMAYSVKKLEPFGFGNPVPMFGIFGVCIEKITELSGGKHLKITFKKADTAFQALLFSVSADKFGFYPGDICDIAVCLDVSEFKGNDTLSIQIKAIRLSGEYPDSLFEDIAAFDDFESGYGADPAVLLPSREQIAVLYKKISASPVSAKRMEYLFTDDPGYAKTQIALKVLRELGLIVFDGTNYTLAPVRAKTELINSKTYAKLKAVSEIDE